MSHSSVFVRLSVMMFLQFFVWGAWYVTTGNLLSSIGWGDQIGTVYALGPIAAMISPLFLGLVADRFFPTQKVLGVLHLCGGGLMFLLPSLANADAQPSTYLWVLQLHVLFYMPTIGLTSTLAFHNLTDQEKQFPIIRMFGALGWIAAGTLVSKVMHADDEVIQYQVAGAAGLLLGVYSFFLPHTPPPSAGKKMTPAEAMGLGALKLLRDPSFVVFIVCSFLICIPLMAYYAFAQVFVGEAGFDHPAYVMSFGQWVEVGFMLIMPLMFRKWGVKWMLAAGMFAWVLRYGLFSFAEGPEPVQWMVFVGILLHGICYDFFFVTGYIYVDKIAPVQIRAQAQGFLVLMTLGVGSFVGSLAMGKVVEDNTPETATAVLAEAQELQIGIKAIDKAIDDRGDEATPAEREKRDLLSAERHAKLISVRDWKPIWQIPMWGALAVLLAFVAFFRYRPKETSADETAGSEPG